MIILLTCRRIARSRQGARPLPGMQALGDTGSNNGPEGEQHAQEAA
jgi:hypothetical protein